MSNILETMRDFHDKGRWERQVERKRIPEEWIGRTVKVGIRTSRGRVYWTFGWLQDVTEDGITLSTTDPLDRSTPKSYPWSSIEDVRSP
jgi:hypothetical protein